MNERDFKGVWIPKEIWLADDIGWTAKLLLVEIDSLAKNGECFASNEYLAKFFGLSKDRISKLVKELKNKGYIETKMIYKPDTKQIEKRIITTIGYRQKCLEGIGENNYTPIGENNEDNNTVFNNTSINTKSKGKAARFTPPALEEVQAYIAENNFNVDAERFIDYYTANGWQVGKSKMKDWRATVRNWNRREQGNKQQDKPRVEIWDADSLPF